MAIVNLPILFAACQLRNGRFVKVNQYCTKFKNNFFKRLIQTSRSPLWNLQWPVFPKRYQFYYLCRSKVAQCISTVNCGESELALNWPATKSMRTKSILSLTTFLMRRTWQVSRLASPRWRWCPFLQAGRGEGAAVEALLRRNWWVVATGATAVRVPHVGAVEDEGAVVGHVAGGKIWRTWTIISLLLLLLLLLAAALVVAVHWVGVEFGCRLTQDNWGPVWG